MQGREHRTENNEHRTWRESFREWTETAQKISEAKGSDTKTRLCTEYFRAIESDDELKLAARFFGEGAFSDISGKRISAGSRTIATLAAEICEINYEKVFKPCKTATGSSSETIEKLFTNIPEARKKWTSQYLSLSQIFSIYERLYQASSRKDKQKILREAWSQMSPLEVKYFIRIMGRGSLKIGLEPKNMVSAIAMAFGQKTEEARYVYMITGSIGETAILARNNQLQEAPFRLFHPLAFMPASPVDSCTVDDFSRYIAEEKFDGIRCQIHASGKKVRVFSHNLNDITKFFTEITQMLAGKNLPGIVLDGAICAFKNNTILPSQFLQKRMKLKKPSREIIEKYPSIFISCDLLFYDGKPIFDQTLLQRRKLLKEISEVYNLPVSAQKEIEDESRVEELLKSALAHGNEGLIIKRKNSTYEYGQRSKSWLKVKKSGGSLVVVIMYAHTENGNRDGMYSGFTLGISVKEDERYEEEFIPIGKAYGGCTDKELNRLNDRIKEITVEKYGPTLGLLPDIVVELEFDDIQINKRTKAKYSLRLPRFKAIRWDLAPENVDTLKEVERTYREKIERERLGQDKNPSFIQK